MELIIKEEKGETVYNDSFVMLALEGEEEGFSIALKGDDKFLSMAALRLMDEVIENRGTDYVERLVALYLKKRKENSWLCSDCQEALS